MSYIIGTLVAFSIAVVASVLMWRRDVRRHQKRQQERNLGTSAAMEEFLDTPLWDWNREYPPSISPRRNFPVATLPAEKAPAYHSYDSHPTFDHSSHDSSSHHNADNYNHDVSSYDGGSYDGGGSDGGDGGGGGD